MAGVRAVTRDLQDLAVDPAALAFGQLPCRGARVTFSEIGVLHRSDRVGPRYGSGDNDTDEGHHHQPSNGQWGS